MRRAWFVLVLFVVASGVLIVQAQAPVSSKSPFTAKEVEVGKQLAAKSLEIRAQIKEPGGPAEPFKMIGNLYWVGEQNGEVYLLTSPQGHIMFGAGYLQGAQGVEQNIAKMGFKLSDIKVILINHNHPDQTGASSYFKLLPASTLSTLMNSERINVKIVTSAPTIRTAISLIGIRPSITNA